MLRRKRLWIGLVVFGIGLLLPFYIRHRAARSTQSTRPPTTRIVTYKESRFWSTSSSGPLIAEGFLDDDDRWYALASDSAILQVGRFNATTGAGRGLGHPIAVPPLVRDGRMFFADRKRGVVALDTKSLDVIWERLAPGYVLSLTTSNEDRLVAATTQRIWSVRTIDGTPLWSHPVDQFISTAVAADDRHVAFATVDHVLHVLDARTGNERSAIPLDRAVRGPIVIDRGRAFVCAAPQVGVLELSIYSIDLAAGCVRWRTACPVDIVLGPEAVSGPVAGGGIVCFSFQEHFNAIDADTGQIRWRFRPDYGDGLDLWRRSSLRVPLVGAATIRDGIAYAVGADRVVGIDIASGREVWRYHREYERSGRGTPLPHAPSIRGNVLLYADSQVAVHGIHLDPAKPVTPTQPLGASMTSRGLLAAGGVALVLLIVIMVLRRWRAMTALVCVALIGALAYAWSRSFVEWHFVGQQRLATDATHVAILRRGVTSRDGSIVLGSVTQVWDASIAPKPPGLSGGAAGEFGYLREPAPGAAEGAHEPPPHLGFLNFDAALATRASGSKLGPHSTATVTVPHWLVIALLSIPPLAWLSGRWRDRRRYPKGHCPKCGYDLRASPDRCPECGWMKVVKPAH